MARSHARLKMAMFSEDRDADLGSLTTEAKLLYVVILTEPALNQAGVVVLRAGVWADEASLDQARFDAAFAELQQRRFIVVDERTSELLVRSFIRNDGVADQPNVLKGALSQALQVRSRVIQRALAVELRRLPPKQEDRVGKHGRLIVYPDPHACAAELDPEASREPSENPSGNPSAKGSEDPSGNPTDRSDMSDSGTLRGTLPGTLRRTPGGRGRGRGEPSVTEYSSGHHARPRTPARNPINELAGTAHSPTAHRLVQAYAATCRRRPPTKIASQLAVEVDALLREDWPEPDIAAALTAWGAKGLGPGALQAVAHEIANTPQDGQHLRAVPTPKPGPDDPLTDEQVDDIVGPESPPYPPAEVSDRGIAACNEWARDAIPRWREQRRDRARVILRRRAAYRAAAGQ